MAQDTGCYGHKTHGHKTRGVMGTRHRLLWAQDTGCYGHKTQGVMVTRHGVLWAQDTGCYGHKTIVAIWEVINSGHTAKLVN